MLVFFSRGHLVEIPKIPRLLKQEWRGQEPTELHTLIHIFTVWAMHCPKSTLSISDLCACWILLRVCAERSVLLSEQRKISVPMTLQNSGAWYHLSDDRSPCKTHQKWLQLPSAFLMGSVSLWGWAEAHGRHWMFTKGFKDWLRVNPMKSNPNKQKKHTSTSGLLCHRATPRATPVIREQPMR